MANKIIFLLFTVLLFSCGSIDDILESNNIEYKKEKAYEFFKAKEYEKANTIFENIVSCL